LAKIVDSKESLQSQLNKKFDMEKLLVETSTNKINNLKTKMQNLREKIDESEEIIIRKGE